jgi:hypothetical protein
MMTCIRANDPFLISSGRFGAGMLKLDSAV